jgi:hypothetical protein
MCAPSLSATGCINILFVTNLMKHSIQSNPDFFGMKYYFLAEMMLKDTDGNPNTQGVILSHSGKDNGQARRGRFVAEKGGR